MLGTFVSDNESSGYIKCGKFLDNLRIILILNKSLFSEQQLIQQVRVQQNSTYPQRAVCVRRGECIGSWLGNRRERDHWGNLGVDRRIILGWISRRWDVGIWTGLSWCRIETGGVNCDCSNELSGSVKYGEFLD